MSPSPEDSRKPLALESLLKRDRQFILFALAVIALASCYYTIRMSGFFDSGKHGHGHTEIDALLLFGMWTVMMVAMMLPSVTPAVLLVAALSRKNRPNSSPFPATTWFLFGYIAVWTLFSAVAAFGQVLLHNFALLNADMASCYTSGGRRLSYSCRCVSVFLLEECMSPALQVSFGVYNDSVAARRLRLFHNGYHPRLLLYSLLLGTYAVDVCRRSDEYFMFFGAYWIRAR